MYGESWFVFQELTSTEITIVKPIRVTMSILGQCYIVKDQMQYFGADPENRCCQLGISASRRQERYWDSENQMHDNAAHTTPPDSEHMSRQACPFGNSPKELGIWPNHSTVPRQFSHRHNVRRSWFCHAGARIRDRSSYRTHHTRQSFVSPPSESENI